MNNSPIVPDAAISVAYVQDRAGWLRTNLPPGPLRVPTFEGAARIEDRAAWTESKGPQPLWEGYASIGNYRKPTAGSMRLPSQVRTQPAMGAFFHWLTATRRSDVIVEFGTAFGVSGMYWLSGLEANRHGRLLTFEPNVAWAEIAAQNLAAIGSRSRLTVGTFEDNIEAALGDGRIDIAFVDAIHTSDFVLRQFALLQPRMSAGGLILFDDINFSADMAAAWTAIARDPAIHASATLGRRLGIVELTS